MSRPDMWHEPPNSTDSVKKLNHRSGRYAVWGRGGDAGERWQVMDGQGPESRPASDEFATRDEAVREAERLMEEDRRSNRGVNA